MKIADFIFDSPVDGDGLRTVVFFQGCDHRCEGCFNPQTWDFTKGLSMTVDEVFTKVDSNTFSKKVTLSGGDPLYQVNEVLLLVKKFKRMGYNIWLYTGFSLEEVVSDWKKRKVLDYVDVIVTDPFILGEKVDIGDKESGFRGSYNQRIIHLGGN